MNRLLVLVFALAIAGCGGGGSSGGGTAGGMTLSGVAAVGAPVVGGTVAVKCAAGPAIPSATTGTPTGGSSGGDWTITATGQTLPCAVQVTGGTINGSANLQFYRSIASAAGTVNITPVSDLVVQNLTGVDFNTLTPATLGTITPVQVTTSVSNVVSALGLTSLSGINPLTTSFVPNSGNVIDDTLSALKTAMTSASLDMTALRTAATSAGSSFTVSSALASAWQTAYSSTASGGGSNTTPTLTSASGMGGLISVGNPLYILGANLGNNADSFTVTFTGGASANTTLSTAATVTVTVPAGAQSGTISVRNNRTSVTLVSSFSITVQTTASRCVSRGSITTTTLPASGAAATAVSDCSLDAPGATDVQWLNNAFVAVGGGVNKSSLDGYQWTSMGTSTLVDAIQFNGTRWVGIVMNSSTPRTVYSSGVALNSWTTQAVTLSTPGEFTRIAVANGRFFIGTNNGSLLVSANGTSWTESANSLCGGTSNSPAYAGNSEVTWNGTQYVFRIQATSFVSASLCTSTDGATWTTASTTPPPSEIYAYSGSKYVASSGTTIYTSVDKIHWIASAVPAPAFSQLVWTGTQYIGLVRLNSAPRVALYRSTDGLRWTEEPMTMPSGLSLASARFAYSPTLHRTVVIGLFTDVNGVFVSNPGGSYVWHDEPAALAVATVPAPTGLTATTVSYSAINLSWSAVSGVVGYDVYRATVSGAALSAMTKVASNQSATTFSDTGLNGSTAYYYTVTGVVDAAIRTAPASEATATTQLAPPPPTSWTNRSASFTNVNFSGIVWNGSRFIAIGNGSGSTATGYGKIFTSTDGVTWTAQTAVGAFADAIAANNSISVLVANGLLWTSADGVSWTQQSSGTTNYLTSVASNGSGFVVAGDAGTILTSPDGINWTTRTSGSTDYLIGASWIGSQYVVMAYSGVILTSPDGVTWTPRTTDFVASFNAATGNDAVAVAVGASGALYSSTDGVTWTSRSGGGSNYFYDVVWAGTRFIAVANGGKVLASTDGINWTAETPGVTTNISAVAWSGSTLVLAGSFQTLVTSP